MRFQEENPTAVQKCKEVVQNNSCLFVCTLTPPPAEQHLSQLCSVKKEGSCSKRAAALVFQTGSWSPQANMLQLSQTLTADWSLSWQNSDVPSSLVPRHTALIHSVELKPDRHFLSRKSGDGHHDCVIIAVMSVNAGLYLLVKSLPSSITFLWRSAKKCTVHSWKVILNTSRNCGLVCYHSFVFLCPFCGVPLSPASGWWALTPKKNLSKVINRLLSFILLSQCCYVWQAFGFLFLKLKIRRKYLNYGCQS